MKKTFLIYLIISVLLISLIFSCKTDGPDSNNTEGGSKESIKIDPHTTSKDAIKKFKDSNKHETSSTENASKAVENNGSKSIADKYSTSVFLKLELKDTLELNKNTLTIYEGTAKNNVSTKILTIKESEIDKFKEAISQTAGTNVGKSSFKADVEVTATDDTGKGGQGADKTITVHIAKSSTTTAEVKDKLFFDLGTDGTEKLPSYMITKAEAQKIKTWLENAKTKLQAKKN